MTAQDAPGRTGTGGTIAGRLADTLRNRILAGDLEPGARLNLDRMRETLDVGVSTLREAVSRLVADGLVEVEEQRGYRVAPVSADNLDEVTALRVLIEPMALRRAIANGGLEWETEVTGALYRLNHTPRDRATAEAAAQWERAHAVFHRTLISRCDMPVTIRIHRMLMNMHDRYRRLLPPGADGRDIAAEHSAIADAAIGRRSDEAADLLAAHIGRTGADLRLGLAASGAAQA